MKIQRFQYKHFTKAKFFVIIVLAFFSQSCLDFPEKKYLNIFCDAETISEDQNYLCTSIPSINFRGGGLQTNEESFSGKYSIKLTKKKAFGMTYTIDRVRTGEFYQVSVWRKSSDKNGVLVVSGKPSDKFYKAGKDVFKKTENSWELIIVEVEIPPDMDNEKLSVYVWNQGKTPVYFDDLSIEQKAGKVYPTFDEEALKIFIDTLEMQKLYKKRKKAFEKGILQSSDNDYVKAIIFYNNEMLKAKVRLKGDWLDHLQGAKWSFRIKMKKEFAWKNMRTFSIQNPNSRFYLGEYFLHKIFEKEDVLTTRYGFVPVVLNNRSLGIYAYEEHFDKQLIESKKRREGPILKFSEEFFWVWVNAGIDTEIFYKTPKTEPSSIIPFKMNRTLRDSNLREQFFIGQNLMYQYKNILRPASEIFNVEYLAKYYAIIDLVQSYHGIIWHNQRMYYNPVVCKLEPIGFDNFASGPYKFGKRQIFGNFDDHDRDDKAGYMRSFLFNDSSFLHSYIHYLEKFSSEKYVDELFDSLYPEIKKNEKILQKEFPFYNFDSLSFRNNAIGIINELDTFKQKIYLETYPKDFENINYNYVEEYDKSLISGLVKSYLDSISDQNKFIKILNFNSKKIEVLGTGKYEKFITAYIDKKTTVNSYYSNNNYSETVETDSYADFIFFMIEGHDEIFSSRVNQWQSPKNTSPYQEIIANNNFSNSNPYFSIKGKTVLFDKKNQNIEDNIVIPAGYKVIFEAGTTLNFLNSSTFISFSPIEMNGKSDEQIFIKSEDGSAQGFSVFQAKNKSFLENVVFENLNTLDFKSWTLTGAVNFYESEVEMNQCHFISNNCEDALNIIRSDFLLNNCTFENIFADAFDSDFCKGTIENSSFTEIGNDAIDFSGSVVIIKNCKILSCGDKGISGGENSKLTVANCKLENTNIGIASKDLSNVNLDSIEISNSKYGLVAFRKKPEFGAAFLNVNNLKYSNITHNYLIEKGSKLILENDTIFGTNEKVAEIFYK